MKQPTHSDPADRIQERNFANPSFRDIEDAVLRLDGEALRTPLLSNPALDAHTGRRVLLKAELFQLAGSFKFRGAFNRIAQLNSEERKAGVIAWSSGNHAQGVAAAAARKGVRARIVMPQDSPKIKIENTKALGAEVIHYDRYSEDREAISSALAERDGGVIVPSYDDVAVIAGQGTAGHEIFTEATKQGRRIDALLVCCGGGGLTAGCALAAQAMSPATDLFCVEPEYYDDHARSLLSGRRESADTGVRSICDALLSPTPGAITFEINRHLLTAGLVVTEDEVKHAMRFAFRYLKLVLEPGGAVALAALLADKVPNAYETVAVMLSGGNVDPDLFAAVLNSDAT
ncbi:MAG: threonine/serine dehydratase [Pseudomonadota bacterium]